MQLFEFEGKKLFKSCGIAVPKSQLLESESQRVNVKPPLVLKAQVLSGYRAGAGGIVKITEIKDLRLKIKELFQKTINNEKVGRLLVEEAIDIASEYYISFSYSTETRGSVLTFGKGGSRVGSHFDEASQNIDVYPIDILAGFNGEDLPKELMEAAQKLWEVFTKYDCELAEINPLVVDRNGKVWALDAKIILDDDGGFRREIKLPERTLFGRPPTQREIEARKIDEGDHRGTAGSVYWDLPGDIAVIAAGGGGSIVNMDALLAYGGKPANYTEHSGNPPREKLKKLTKIVLSKPGLKGCWFVGGTANFTDIYETLMGFVEGLRELKPKPKYPIVIRRGGPRDKEAFEALKEIGEKEGFDFHIFGRETPMTSTAKIMKELAYGNTNN
ncbi:hypothetical protein HYZ06_00595 [Candidatus Daviesbacteria bacterium]|nr:hypothetical protein [Candidatus Daviesbacteria bacterium]